MRTTLRWWIASSVALCVAASGVRADHPDERIESPGSAVPPVAAEPTPDDAPSLAERLAGHSMHGEAFNEGPRQAAYLMEGMGEVDFPVTTDNAEAQAFFNQGVAQLHGFWYFEAERSFRQVALLDPDCAMAYWGMSKANFNNEERAAKFIKEAVARRDQADDRERMYIDALAAYHSEKNGKRKRQRYVRALENIIHAYPDDLEAKAFLAVQIWHNSVEGASITSYEAVDALIQQVLAQSPLHPIHHYRIHLWNYHKDERALDSAAACGFAAPGIAHMWHMPGHIYSRLHRYADAAWHQEASARVDHAHMMRDRVMPDQIHNYAHNNQWLIEDLIHVGRAGDALDLATNMVELPRHPRYNIIEKEGSARYGTNRLMDVLADFELHEQTIALCSGAHLPPLDDFEMELRRLRLLGAAHFEMGDIEAGDAIISELSTRLEVAESQDNKSRKRAFNKALCELRGRRLLQQGDLEAARQQFEHSDLNRSTKALLMLRAGDLDEAVELAEKEAERADNQVLPLAHLAHILHVAGRPDEAAEAFQKLRNISEDIDLAAPPFARLAPLARSLNLPDDWRMARDVRDDIRERPALDALGPFRWQPVQAPNWSLIDSKGSSVSLADYRGRPVILVFYLGAGCLHCVEQLNALTPMKTKFDEAGIEIVALSTSDPNDLTDAVASYEQHGPYPFKLISNAELDVFKAYRAYDDFEQMPLHGTFLIDAQGRIRWQDISYEPFTDVEFLLAESQRLLRQ